MAEDRQGQGPTNAEEDSVRQVATQGFLTLWSDLQRRIEVAAGGDLVMQCQLKRTAARALLLSAVSVAEDFSPQTMDWLFSRMWAQASIPEGIPKS